MVLSVRFLLTLGVLVMALVSSTASAQRETSSDAFDRLAEALEPLVDGGALAGQVPMIIVGARPAFEATRAWFPTAAVVALGDAVGRANLRACEACMNPRATAEGGAFVYSSGALSVAEIVAIDNDTRGDAPPAKSAAWVDETDGGISVRIISLATGALIFAQNLDGSLQEKRDTASTLTRTADVERRLRGESLTHVWIDAALFPNQHISLDVVDQFGDKNLDMAGITFSLFDPIVGVGAAYYRVIPEAFNLTVGLQGVVSIPTAAGNALGIDGDVIDPLLTGVLVVRWPIPQTAYAIVGTASTNGNIGIGVSLLNINFLPVLP